jgi:hypothetical protein
MLTIPTWRRLRIYAEEYHDGPGSVNASVFAQGLRTGYFRGRPFAYPSREAAAPPWKPPSYRQANP